MRRLLALLRHPRRVWLEADCGCMYTVDPVQVLVCYGHSFDQERIAKGMEALFGVDAP